MTESLASACLSDDEIVAFLEGRLAGERAFVLEAHASICPTCRQLLSALGREGALILRTSSDSVSPTLPSDPRAGETDLPLGTRIGRYVVTDWLGAGGMGIVYAGYDPELDRKVALKVLRNEGVGSADRLPIHDVLLREAQAMAQLAHPNVVTVFDVGSVGDRVFIAMELIAGMTLDRWLAAAHRETSEIIAVFIDAGRGLAAAHAARLIHRDFKPSNLLIGNDGRVRVTDFGLARRAPGLAPAPGATAAVAEGTTSTGLAGTLAYMAPEQYFRKRIDARADQFSFAVTLYEALYGQRPVLPYRAGEGSPQNNGVIAIPASANVPVAVRRVLERALSRDPGDRYPSMDALLTALTPEPRRRRGRAMVVTAIATAVVAVASAGAYALHLRGAAQPPGELIGHLRSLAPELRVLLRNAHLLPLHDIRPAREEVRRILRDVERERKASARQDEIALCYFILGEGHRALGEDEQALAMLEAAWAAGERGPQMDAAQGQALGAAYERELEDLETTVESTQRESRIRALEQRYRDPALAHLRAALASRTGSPSYLEATIAFHDHRFAESAQKAHAAFVESPTYYEAGALAARAHNKAASGLRGANKLAESAAEFDAALKTFDRVLLTARSDDEVWLSYAEMLLDQAVALAGGGALPADLEQRAMTALHNVQQINPDNAGAYLDEAHYRLVHGNFELISYQDPSHYVAEALPLLEAARARGADVSEVDSHSCYAHWQLAQHRATHGMDPRAEFEIARAACERAIAVKGDSETYNSLGVVYTSLAVYEGDHGTDPGQSFDRAERNLRALVALDGDAAAHYNLARLWIKRADYQERHGQDPERAVAAALAEFETTQQLYSTRVDAWAGTSDALTTRAEVELRAHRDPAPILTQARAVLERASASQIEANHPVVIRSWLQLSELEARAALDRDADPSAAIERARANARLLVKLPSDRLAHRLWCRAELVAARWALAHRRPADDLLNRAAAEAALAREADAMDAEAWTASAEVEQLRAETTGARDLATRAALIDGGLSYAERAITIDGRLERALRVRDELTRARASDPPVGKSEQTGRALRAP